MHLNAEIARITCGPVLALIASKMSSLQQTATQATAEHDRTCRCNVINEPDFHNLVITSEIPCRNCISRTKMNTNRLVRHLGTSSHSMSMHIPCNRPIPLFLKLQGLGARNVRIQLFEQSGSLSKSTTNGV